MEPSKLHREIISRSTMGVLGLGLSYGGYKCLWFARLVAQEVTVRQGRVVGLAALLGIALLILGGILVLAAITPTSVFARIMGPPTNTTLWDTQAPTSNRRWWV